jgi:2-dehydro-3-deoxyphosphooctonate aldolase (KDO 8-P synthase)
VNVFEPGGPFFVIAGPCVLEGPDLNLRVARHVRDVTAGLGVPAIFKASFDKANRTSVDAPRGPGLEAGLALLRQVRDDVGIPVLTDVHEAGQAELAAAAADVLQVPAFLCRQTDLLCAAAVTGRPVNVKKGQWMAPEDMRHSIAKLRTAGATQVAVTERGTFFGYGRWVVDMRSFPLIKDSCGCPAVFDATHSVQLPGAGVGGTASGGEPAHIGTLARAAVAAGADGLFVELHPDPQNAPSDGGNMLEMEALEPLLEELLAIRAAVQEPVTQRST